MGSPTKKANIPHYNHNPLVVQQLCPCVTARPQIRDVDESTTCVRCANKESIRCAFRSLGDRSEFGFDDDARGGDRLSRPNVIPVGRMHPNDGKGGATATGHRRRWVGGWWWGGTLPGELFLSRRARPAGISCWRAPEAFVQRKGHISMASPPTSRCAGLTEAFFGNPQMF